MCIDYVITIIVMSQSPNREMDEHFSKFKCDKQKTYFIVIKWFYLSEKLVDLTLTDCSNAWNVKCKTFLNSAGFDIQPICISTNIISKQKGIRTPIEFGRIRAKAIARICQPVSQI